MTYYCTVHKDEDQEALVGEQLDAMNIHMVFDAGYDIDGMRDVVFHHPWKAIWVMRKHPTAKFGYAFDRLYGIPRAAQGGAE